MSVGTRYRKIPLEVEAVRYGKDEDGQFYPGAVQRVAQFILGLEADAEPTNAVPIEVVRPAPGKPWDPGSPVYSQLEIFDAIAHGQWLPLELGDYVIRGVNGEVYPCKADIFAKTYEDSNASIVIVLPVDQTVREVWESLQESIRLADV